MDDPKFLTVAQAAMAIGITKRSAQRLVAAGALPVVRFSRRTVRVPVAALDALAQDAIDAIKGTESVGAEAS